MRFVNVKYHGAANIYVNSVLKLQSQGFGLVDSAYLQASSGPQTVEVKTSWGQLLASAPITFAVDTPYTVVNTTEHLLVFPDTFSIPALLPDTAPPPAGIASFRVMNVASNAAEGTVDVYRTTGSTVLTDLTPIASDVAFEAMTPYTSYPAGPTRIIATQHGNPFYVLYDSGIRTVSADEAWTIFLLEAVPYVENGETFAKLLDLWLKDRG